MRQSEKEMMIKEYQKQFNYFLLSNGKSEREKDLLNGQKQMMKLFFTNKEINKIENEMRVTSQYRKDFFEVIESWLRQIEKEQGEKEIYFTWDLEGLDKVSNHYDWLLEEYKGLRLAISNTYNLLQKAS